MTIEEKEEHLLETLQAAGINDVAVLAAMKEIPRQIFVLPEHAAMAYEDIALPIECQQTISQPYIVALMSQALHKNGSLDKVLEIGTGSGYQTAILAQLAKQVYTVERIQLLHDLAKQRLQQLEIKNIKFHYGDGYLGWEEFAPYDAIIVTAAVDSIPAALLAQLKDGGRMVIPLEHSLVVVHKTAKKLLKEVIELVSFVPLTPDVE